MNTLLIISNFLQFFSILIKGVTSLVFGGVCVDAVILPAIFKVTDSSVSIIIALSGVV